MRTFLMLTIVLIAAISSTNAATPPIINYSGVLADSAGTGLDTTINLTFAIYNSDVGGFPIWLEVHTDVIITKGLFTVLLGSTTPLEVSLFESITPYLGITVGADPEISPRTKLVSVPYSFNSEFATTANFATLAQSANTAEFADTAALALLALNAIHANNADSAIHADNADSAIHADNADSAIHANNADSAVHAVNATNAASAVFSDSTDAITDGAVDMADIVQAGATSGQVLKWNGSAWAPAADETDSTSGWTDDGTVIRLDWIGDSVGIGTATPAEKLDVIGNIHASGTLSSGNSIVIDGTSNRISSTSGLITFTSNLSVTKSTFPTLSSLSTHASSDAFVNSVNNLGYSVNIIAGGSSSPFSSFGMSRANLGIVITSNGTSGLLIGNFSSVPLIFGTDDTERARIDGTGNFGIGTSTPSEKLDVIGNLIVSGKANIGPGNANAGLNAFVTGASNSASGQNSTVSGGRNNTASGDSSTVSGGASNTASGKRSTVGGGINNTASGGWSTVSGGYINTASGTRSTVSGGFVNTASGFLSTIGGGFANTAKGDYSVTIGNLAKAQHNGSIVISTKSSGLPPDSIASGGNEQLVIRAGGGLYLTNISEAAPFDPSRLITTRGGAYLSGNGTTWTNASDKYQKENFTDIDSEDLLEKISELPISRWNYKDEDETVTHIGPMAQDFYALFGVGADDVSISTIDPAGIALAAIQELIKKSKRVDALEQNNRELNKRLEKLGKMIGELSKK